MSAPANAACRMLPNLEVQHYNCSDYANGVITKVTNGKNNGAIVARIIDGKRVEA